MYIYYHCSTGSMCAHQIMPDEHLAPNVQYVIFKMLLRVQWEERIMLKATLFYFITGSFIRDALRKANKICYFSSSSFSAPLTGISEQGSPERGNCWCCAEGWLLAPISFCITLSLKWPHEFLLSNEIDLSVYTNNFYHVFHSVGR